jgi:phosphoglucosamine mutase
LTPDKIGVSILHKDAVVLYLEKAKSFIEASQPLKGLRIVLYCANGVFSEIMPQVFKDLGAGVIVLGNHPDGYNINKDCGSQHCAEMLEIVRNSKAHLGVAVDGDGDRIVVCDEKGEKIAGENAI